MKHTLGRMVVSIFTKKKLVLMMFLGILVLVLLVFVSMVNTMNTIVILPWHDRNLTAVDHQFNYQTRNDQTQGITNYQTSLHIRKWNSKPVLDVKRLNRSIDTALTNGYIIINSFEEQLQSAINDLYQLANVISPLRLQIVEPLTTRSFLGFPNSNKTDEILHFGDLFNLSMANHMFGKCLGIDYPIIASHEEFASQSQHIAKVKLLKLAHVCPRSFDNEARVAARQVNDYLLHRSATKIRVSETTCVRTDSSVNFKQLFQSFIDDQSQSDYSEMKPRSEQNHTGKMVAILPHWHGIKTTKDRFFYWDPDYTGKRCPVHTLECSNSVKKAAESFSEDLQLQRPYLGVHIRLERLIQDDSNQPGFLKSCIDKLITVVSDLIQRYELKPQNIVVVRDFGKQGSATCEGRHQCRKVASQLQIEQRLRNLGAYMREYVPSDIGMHHNGFISSVEKELLSTADYLLVIGRGSFQRGVVDRFRANHPPKGGDRLYTLCSSVYGEHLPGLDVEFG